MKPREWFACIYKDKNVSITCMSEESFEDDETYEEAEHFKVIEKTAYDSLAAELEKEKTYSAETHARFEEQNERITALIAENEQLKNDLDAHSKAELEAKIQRIALERDQWKAQAEKLAEALNWIGAIKISPKESWPSHENIEKHANEALAAFEAFKKEQP